MTMRRRGKRGKHTSPRRPLSASKEEWKAWDAAAGKAWPWTFAAWARDVLNRAAARPAPRRISARVSTTKRRPHK